MTAAAILTGGRARRFHGLDKSSLVVSRGDGGDGRSFLEHQLEALAAIAGDILIVTSAARAADFPTSRLPRGRVVRDRYPDTGPLGGVLTAIEAAAGAPVLVLAADMPHVSASLVAALAALHAAPGTTPGEPADHDATVPHSARGAEPLCAVYAASALPALHAALASGDLSLRQALARLRVRVMPLEAVAAIGDPALLFRNINSPADL